MEDTSEFNEVSQLRTRCTILESQIEVLEKQNIELKELVTKLYPDTTGSGDPNMKRKWKDIQDVGKFPTDVTDDGDFQLQDGR